MTANRPLTIVHISSQKGWRGGEAQIRLLAQGQRARGHRCVVLARAGGALAQRMTREGFAVKLYHGRATGLRAFRHIRWALRRLTPDVVHFHDAQALAGGGLAALALGIPARVATRRVDFPIRSAWKYRRLCDVVIAVSRAIKRVCVARGLRAENIRVVHEGVTRGGWGDRARGRRALGLTDDEVLLLCAAALTDHKGHTYLLKALPEVCRRHPMLRVALAGDGELRQPLEMETRALGLERQVRFLGFRDDIADLLRAADLFVMPSHLEGLCTSLMDAMFARLAIVCTTAGGMPEVVEAVGAECEPVAFVCPPRDPDGLARALLAALDSPARRAKLVDRAERRAARLFIADVMVAGNLAVYQDTIRPARNLRTRG